MKKDSKIFLAGHRGMVGSALGRALRANGYNNIIVRTHSELDLTRQNDVEAFFDENRPEYVFLAAAKVGGILANNTYKAEFIYQNIMIASNVIDAAYKYGVKKLLNLGSSCIYPKHAPQPMSEDCLLSSSLEPTNEAYAVAKIAALKMCRYYNEQYNTNFISVMPTNLYGPDDDFNLETGHVLPALLRKFHLAKLLSLGDYEGIRNDIRSYRIGFNYDLEIESQDSFTLKKVLNHLGVKADAVTIWGTGEAYREFMLVDELSDACLFLMEKFDYQDIGEILNIGTGKDIKIKDLAEMIKEVVGFEGEIVFDSSKPDGTPRKLLNVSRISDLGWKATIELEEGLKNTYEWYCSKIYSSKS